MTPLQFVAGVLAVALIIAAALLWSTRSRLDYTGRHRSTPRGRPAPDGFDDHAAQALAVVADELDARRLARSIQAHPAGRKW